MPNNSPRQFHETVVGYVLVGVLIALVSWFIERAIEQRGSLPAPSVSESVPTGAPESQTASETSVPTAGKKEPNKEKSHEERPKSTKTAEPAPDSTSGRDDSTSRSLPASELTVTAYTKAGQR